MHALILFSLLLIGVANGFINVTGGGGGLITTPLLLTLGLTPYASLATSKFVPIGGLVAGGAKYYREKIITKNTLLFFLAFVVSIGAIIGANLTLSISEHILKYIILIFTVIILVLSISPHGKRNNSMLRKKKMPETFSFGTLFWSFIVSIYQGSIGIGGGIFLAAVFRNSIRYSYLESAALMNILSALITIIAAVTFTVKGVVNYQYGIPLFIGSIIGGYLGAHIAIKKGDKLLKVITILVSIGLLVKILLT